MGYEYEIAQVIGFVCFLFGLWRLQLKFPRSIILCDIPMCSLWSVHYFLIGGVSGFIINALSVIRALFRCYTSKKTYTVFSLIILALIWALCLYFYEAYYSLLPPIASTIFTFGMLSEDRQKLTNCIISHNILWVLYGICLLSPLSCLSPAAGIVSAVIGKYRHEGFRLKRAISLSLSQPASPCPQPFQRCDQRWTHHQN